MTDEITNGGQQTQNVGNDQVPTDGAQNPEVVKSSEPKEDLEFSRRFAALTRMEREIQEKAERNKSQFTEVEEWKKEKGLIKSNPKEFLEKNGWNIQDLVDFVLNDEKPTANREMQELREEINKLRSEREDEKTTAQKQQEAKNVETYKGNLKNKLIEKKETYELINQYEQFDMVYDIMNEEFSKTGQELDVDKVAAEVEKYLEAQFEDQFKKASNTSKFKSRFAAPAQDKQQEPGVLGTEKKSPATLSNLDLSGASNAASEARRETILDEEESKRRSAKMIQEAWNKKLGK